MEKPIFIRIQTLENDKVISAYAPANKPAFHLTELTGKRYLTVRQFENLFNAGIEPQIKIKECVAC